jgi:hypothetical protein
VQTIQHNTLAVLKDMPNKHAEWRQAIADVLTQTQAASLQQDADFLTAILALLDGDVPEISTDNLYVDVIHTLSHRLAHPDQAQTLQDDLPLPSDLPDDFVTRCAAGLNGSLQEKEALFEYLREVNRQTTSPAVSTLIKNIQFVLFGKKPVSLNPALPEPYAAVWQQIIDNLT